MAFTAYDRARVEARTPRGGYFAGVPTVVKDNVDVAGMPTRQGTDAWRPTAARRDGDFARMYLGTGLIPLGKSQLSEYGFSGAAEHPRLGPVRTPWSTDHVAGASSAGSAALVASGAKVNLLNAWGPVPALLASLVVLALAYLGIVLRERSAQRGRALTPAEGAAA